MITYAYGSMDDGFSCPLELGASSADVISNVEKEKQSIYQ